MVIAANFNMVKFIDHFTFFFCFCFDSPLFQPQIRANGRSYSHVSFVCRMLKTGSKLLGNAAKGILDGDLIWKFLNLSLGEKEEIGKKIGSTNDEIVQDLMEIDRLAAHF